MQTVNNPQFQTAVFGGGCFWCTEAVFESLKGVRSVLPGYTGGQNQNPNYEQVSSGSTGHVESIKIEYDSGIISYKDLLTVFFHTHDPTTLNRQGGDIGTQYRSVIFFTNVGQKKEAESVIKELTDSHAYDSPVVTEVVPLDVFYPAEEYHRDYYKNNSGNPYCELVIAPKLEKFQKRFAELLKQG